MPRPRALPLPARLLGQSGIEHLARKTDVPSYTMAKQVTRPHYVCTLACDGRATLVSEAPVDR